jgi:hypothetical protein
MRTLTVSLLLSVGGVLTAPAVAVAGMPSLTFSELPRLRVEGISFFLVVFLLSSWLIQLLWNFLAKDFRFLPRLSYPKAMGVVFLWGLLFVLVLTMISGARELLTPGAWEKQGATYRLAKEKSAQPTEPSPDQARERKLEELRRALWEYAGRHQGQFPADPASSGIPSDLWLVPDQAGLHYRYVKGQKADHGLIPLAYEPGLFGAQRCVLFTDGTIKRWDVAAIVALLPEKP